MLLNSSRYLPAFPKTTPPKESTCSSHEPVLTVQQSFQLKAAVVGKGFSKEQQAFRLRAEKECTATKYP